MFLKLMGIDSICSALLRTVGLFAVRFDLAKLRLKYHKNKFSFSINFLRVSSEFCGRITAAIHFATNPMRARDSGWSF